MNNVRSRAHAWVLRQSFTSSFTSIAQLLKPTLATHQPLRCLTTSAQEAEDTDEFIESSLPPTSQDIELGVDGERSYRLRKHGMPKLPLPVFMDPVKLQKKEHPQRQTKVVAHRIPHEQKSEMQKALEMNPYAHALATPIRQCSITRVRIPEHFLSKFTLRWEERPSGIDGQAQPPICHFQHVPIGQKTQGSGSLVFAHVGAMKFLNARRNWVTLIKERMNEEISAKLGRRTHPRKMKQDDISHWDPLLSEEVLSELRHAVCRGIEACSQIEYMAIDAVRSAEGDGSDIDSRSVASAAVDEVEVHNASSSLLIKMEPDTLESDPAKKLLCVLKLSEQSTEAISQQTVYDLRHLLGQDVFSKVEDVLGRGEAEFLGVLQHARAVPLALALDRLRGFLAPLK